MAAPDTKGSFDGVQITERSGCVRISIEVKPKAAKTKLVGVRNGALTIAVAAPPVEGAANDELVRFLAKLLKCPRAHVSVAVGESSRSKLVDVRDCSAESVRRSLSPALGDI